MVIDKSKQGLIWIKGFSASGKSTVARRVEYFLRNDGYKIISLDGDELRSIFGSKWGYDTQSRHELANSYFRLCSHLSSQGYVVVISAVAMFDSMENWVKVNIPNSVQAYLDVPLEERKNRDIETKKIFTKKNFNEKIYDTPKNPDIVIKNYGDLTPDDAAKQIVEFYNHLDKKEADRNRSEHWGKYYEKNIAPNEPSTFAQYVLPKMKNNGNHLLDVGCGNGRDAVFFSHSGFIVDAIDRSKDAINLCKDIHSNSSVKFYSGEITNIHKTKYNNIYSRFVLHAMPVEEEIVLLKTAFSMLEKDGKMFLECRSINDPLSREGDIISPTERICGHYRRFIILEELRDRLINVGFKVISLLEEKGVAKCADDNPVVIRAIVSK